MPSQVAAQIGAWSPIGFVLIGLRRCRSRSASPSWAADSMRPAARTSTPAPRSAGSSAFEVGWMQWFTRATSQASMMAAIAIALGYYWPVLTTGWPRAAFLIALTLGFGGINVRGMRQSSMVVNVLTIGKLLPLAIFIVVGLAYIEPSRLTVLPPVTVQQSLAAVCCSSSSSAATKWCRCRQVSRSIRGAIFHSRWSPQSYR